MDAECHPLDAATGAAEGGRMTTRKDLVDDMTGLETILLDLDDVTPSGMSDKQVIKAICRCLWHVLEYLIRRAHE